MATNQGPKMEKPPSFLQCKICSKTLTSPKLLSCGHSFCLVCIKQNYEHNVMYEFGNMGEFCCPTCAMMHSMPKEGADGLCTDHRIIDMIQYFSQQQQHPQSQTQLQNPDDSDEQSEDCQQHNREKEDESRFCSPCIEKGDEVPAEIFCMTCQSLMCAGCDGDHKRGDTETEHISFTISNDNINDLICKTHPTLFISKYCQDCNKAVCEECINDDDYDHEVREFMTFKDVQSTKHGRLQTYLSKMKSEVKRRQSTLEEALAQNDMDHSLTCHNIDQKFNDLMKDLTEQKQELLQKANQYKHRVNLNLAGRIRACTDCLDEIQNVSDQHKKMMYPCGDKLKITPDGNSNMDDLTEEVYDLTLPEKLAEKIDYDFLPGKCPSIGVLNLGSQAATSPDVIFDPLQTCLMCFSLLANPISLVNCGHVYCASCLRTPEHESCPRCEGNLLTPGNQPPGEMTVDNNTYNRYSLNFKFPEGTQGSNHPFPGRKYDEHSCTYYIPTTLEGSHDVSFMKKAFHGKHLFSIKENKITEIVPFTSFGGAVPTLEDRKRVTKELARIGIHI